MDQINMKKTEELDRCAMAGCDGTVKNLSLLGGYLKRCGLCNERKPFRRIVKCSECKIVYHRRCEKKPAVTGEVDGCERDVRPTVIQQQTVAMADNPTNAEAMDAIHRGRTLMAVDSAIIRAEYVATGEHAKEATVVGLGGHDLLAVDSAIMRAEYAATDELGTTTTVVAEPTPRPLPRIRASIISPSEYFQCLLDSETKRREAALSSVPRPGGPAARSRFTRADYLKMSASWDPKTFKRKKSNEARRIVYSQIFANHRHLNRSL